MWIGRFTIGLAYRPVVSTSFVRVIASSRGFDYRIPSMPQHRQLPRIRQRIRLETHGDSRPENRGNARNVVLIEPLRFSRHERPCWGRPSLAKSGRGTRPSALRVDPSSEMRCIFQRFRDWWIRRDPSMTLTRSHRENLRLKYEKNWEIYISACTSSCSLFLYCMNISDGYILFT